MSKSIRGFTIVELLIVIVVIGILAAVTIVTYNGIQSRARAAQVVASFDSWETILRSYKAVSPTGQYPILTGDAEVCLGESFPADSTFLNNQCAIYDSGTDFVDTTLMNKLKTVASTLPSGVTPTFSAGTLKLRGIVFVGSPDGSNATMAYYVAGNQTCGRGSASYLGGSGIDATQCLKILY